MNIDIRNLEPELTSIVENLRGSGRWLNTNIDIAKHCIKNHPRLVEERIALKEELSVTKYQLEAIVKAMDVLGMNPDLGKLEKDYKEKSQRFSRTFG